MPSFLRQLIMRSCSLSDAPKRNDRWGCSLSRAPEVNTASDLAREAATTKSMSLPAAAWPVCDRCSHTEPNDVRSRRGIGPRKALSMSPMGFCGNTIHGEERTDVRRGSGLRSTIERK